MAKDKVTQDHGKVGRGTCPVCQRPDIELYRVKVQEDGKPRETSVCYSDKYNCWPLEHDQFAKTQDWRRTHGLSVLSPTKERVEAYKKKEKVVAAVRAAKSPDWTRINDAEGIAKLERMMTTGQMAAGPYVCWCRKPVEHAIAVQMPTILGGKRKVTLGFCSQKCVDDYGAELATSRAHPDPADVLRNPWKYGMMPWLTADGRTKGFFVPGKGFRPLKHGEDEEPVEFCKECDRLAEVCDCKGGPTL